MTSADTSKDLIANAHALKQEGEHAKAIGVLNSILTVDPKDFEAWVALGNIYYSEGEYDKALQAVERAEQCDPLVPDFERVQNAIQSGQFSIAEDIAEKMLEKHEGHPRAVFTYVHLWRRQGAHEKCVELLKHALNVSPANLILRQMLVGAHEGCGEFAEAIEQARQLVRIRESFETHWLLIKTLVRHGFNDESLALSNRAYAACVGDKARKSEIDLFRGHALKTLGQRNGAVEAYQSCIANKPQNGTAWWALADMKNYTFSLSDKGAMQGMLEDPSILPQHKSQTAFALAKAYEVDGDLKSAMPFYIKANNLHRGKFNSQGYKSAVQRLTFAFSLECLDVQSNHLVEGIRDDSPRPIFIVGMPRSGSTLLEQILASHSKIEGTMELQVLPVIKRKMHLECVKRFGEGYLESLTKFPPKELSRFGQMYIEGTELYRSDRKPFFVDKLPQNFEHIGLIHKILPNALIIDARRNPLDCGLSIYKQHFGMGAAYSYDLASIGHYYNGYLDIMDHWNRLLPGKVVRIQYEDVVEDLEIHIKAMLDFIGLDFEESCLNFYKNKRAIRTASSEQVRQPLYSRSIGVWREVEADLIPLKKTLGASTLQRFEKYL